MSRLKKSPSSLIEELTANITPASRQKKVDRAIEVHFQDARQFDGRGRRSSALESTCRALRHLANMPNWKENERYDLNMRRRIRDILKHIDHGQSWSKTIEECSEARGLINKAAKRRNERKEYGPSDARRLNNELVCIPLNSASKLRSAAKRGRNCLGDYDYVRELKSGEAEFYEIKTKSGLSRAFLRIERASRKITEFKGPNNEETDLPAETLLAVCEELDANGDDCEDFLQLGVLSLLRESRSSPPPSTCQILDFQVWWRKGEIVVRDLETRSWSRFIWGRSYLRRRGDEWVESDGSAIDGEAFDLMVRCQPTLSVIAEKARPDSGQEIPSIRGRRRRPRQRRVA